MTIYQSHSINNAKSQSEVVEIVNSGTCEGIEGVEFTSEMLAGCYIYNAAQDDADMSYAELEAQAEILADAGASFNAVSAIKYAQDLYLAE